MKIKRILAAVLAVILLIGDLNIAKAENVDNSLERVINPAEYYDVWWDFEDSIWASNAIGNGIIAEGGTKGATLSHETETENNRYMKLSGDKSGGFRVSRYEVNGNNVASTVVTFDWLPITIQDVDSRFGDISFYSTANDYAFFGLQFDKNKEIKYYTIGENVEKGYGLSYSEEDLEGGLKRNSAINSETAATTGIVADGQTWYTVNLTFNHLTDTADLSIANRNAPSTALYERTGIPIYASAENLAYIGAGGWKAIMEMGIDNFGIKFNTEIPPEYYYNTYWNDFEDEGSTWNTMLRDDIILASSKQMPANIDLIEDFDNQYMKINHQKGYYALVECPISADLPEKAEVTLDWMPMWVEANDTRHGDVSFYSSDNTYAYFGLQVDRNMNIWYYTMGENMHEKNVIVYSEEALEGGIKRNNKPADGTAANTGITADGATWYTVKLNFDYVAHKAAISIAKKDAPDTILCQKSDIPIYASAENIDFMVAGGWKAKMTMALDNVGVRYEYSGPGSIVSVQPLGNVTVLAEELESHVAERPTKATVVMGDNSTMELEIGEWISEPAFDPAVYGNYVWTAPLIVPEGVYNPKNLALTYQMDYVKNFRVAGAYDPTTLEIKFGSVESVEAFEAMRPTKTQVVLSNGEVAYAELDDSSWEAINNPVASNHLDGTVHEELVPDVAPEFDPAKEGIYVYKVKLASDGTYTVDGESWLQWRVNYYVTGNNFNGYDRAVENMDRGLYALKNTVYDSGSGTYVDSAQGGIYLSWRILIDEYEQVSQGNNIVFEVYRNNEKITSLTNITNYLDEGGNVGDTYRVKAIQKGIYSYSKDVQALEDNYISIKLQRPLPAYGAADTLAVYRLNDTAVADVDGDSEYELIVKWYPNNGFDAGKTNAKPSSPHIIDVYEMDGTALWRLFMGYSSPAGQHFDNFMAYDLDQDGKAELSILTQDGTRTYRPDENGQFAYVTTEEGGYVFQADKDADAASSNLESEWSGSYVASADGKGYVLSSTDLAYVGDLGSPYMDDAYLVDVVGDRSKEGIGIRDDGFKSEEVEEYFTVFDGETGKIIDTVDYFYSTEYVLSKLMETNPGTDFADHQPRLYRFNIGIATIPTDISDPNCTTTIPAVICNRAYYADMTHIAYTLVDGKIKTSWQIYIEGFLNGGGNHNLATGDIDNDGFDEIYMGGTAIDHDGTILWAEDGLENRDLVRHGDMIHMAAVFPDSEQLYVMTPVENGSVSVFFNYAMFNGANGGRVVGHSFGKGDTGRGMLANVTPSAGYELWASAQSSDEKGRLSKALYNVYGEVVNKTRPAVQTWASYWDGDLLSELPDSNPSGGADKSGLPMGVHKYNWETGATETIASFAGTWTNNSTKNMPNLTADILGDWREEILVRSTNNEELRIYMTNIPTEYSIYSLMQDPVYRNSVANQNTTYNQPTHTSFYLGEDEVGRNRVLNFELPTYNYYYTTEVPRYTDVAFVSNNGTLVPEMEDVLLGSTITAPENVTKEGYILEGWYLDEECTKAWNFAEDTVEEKITLHAKWTVEDIGNDSGNNSGEDSDMDQDENKGNNAGEESEDNDVDNSENNKNEIRDDEKKKESDTSASMTNTGDSNKLEVFGLLFLISGVITLVLLCRKRKLNR